MRDLPQLLRETVLCSINGFRGQEGQKVLAALALGEDVSAAAALEAYGRASAATREESQSLQRLARLAETGGDGLALVPYVAPKSICSYKSFEPRVSPASRACAEWFSHAFRRETHDNTHRVVSASVVVFSLDRRVRSLPDLEKWVSLLSAELAQRAETDAEVNEGRRPTSLVVGLRGTHWGRERERERERRAHVPSSYSPSCEKKVPRTCRLSPIKTAGANAKEDKTKNKSKKLPTTGPAAASDGRDYRGSALSEQCASAAQARSRPIGFGAWRVSWWPRGARTRCRARFCKSL